MVQINVFDIAQELGICPICLMNEIEAQGIDTFSSRIAFDKIIHVKDFQEAKEPIFRNGMNIINFFNSHFWELTKSAFNIFSLYISEHLYWSIFI